MLREVPLFRQDLDNDPVFMNTATLPPHQDHNETVYVDTLDDVFGSAPSSPVLPATGNTLGTGNNSGQHGARSAEISDIHRLRTTHVTNGYREGIAASKEKFMQEGFDEGYNLGAELGLKVGWCLGALEGIWHALKPSKLDSKHSSSRETMTVPSRSEVAKAYFEAENQLAMQKLYAAEYFGPDGVWLYDVQSKTSDENEVTFDEIAAAHPLVKQWTEKVQSLVATFGLSLSDSVG